MVRGIEKFGYVYIMTNKNRTTLYIGVTNDLCRRIYEHKNHLIKNAFTDKYNLEYCIYYEEIPYFDLAIKREKELKGWNRAKKEDLINKKNPEWKVLVTEHGFVRDKQQIPHCVRNDGCVSTVDGEILRFAQNDEADNNSKGVEGGEAAALHSLSSTMASVIPNGAERNEESNDK
ncbi:hypothetical protein FACS189421_01180 [Bacteroidia bacterium]|nr:hypothetical protein FACS189421_01180 [Bacteroidia bacterium]GHT04531.1 hypothetical protein FACS189423_07350 [Bacteroidia bacterium]GHT46125.1 hypothetical protein FACS189440_03490 [Bacteroidia bacterium]GHT89313.1 hypothetical protein FACS189474_5840 [Bacteroidia bacterium]